MFALGLLEGQSTFAIKVGPAEAVATQTTTYDVYNDGAICHCVSASHLLVSWAVGQHCLLPWPDLHGWIVN